MRLRRRSTPATEVLIRDYRQDQLRRGLASESIRDRQGTLASLAACIAPRGLLEVSTDEVERWLDSRGSAARTRRWHLSNLSSFFTWAIRAELTDVDPTRRIVRPRTPRLLPRPMTPADLRIAISRADLRTRCWVVLGAYQGLRVSEISRLRREDLRDQEHPGLLVVARGKGGHQRVLPLNGAVEAALRDYGLPTSGWVFPGKTDGHIHAETVTKYLSQYFAELGINATAHQLRHAFATAIYRDSHDLRLCQTLLGHASPVTTAIYTAFAPEDAVDVVGRLGKVARP